MFWTLGNFLALEKFHRSLDWTLVRRSGLTGSFGRPGMGACTNGQPAARHAHLSSYRRRSLRGDPVVRESRTWALGQSLPCPLPHKALVYPFGVWQALMKTRLFSWLFCLFCLSFLSAPTFGQCPNQRDRHCWNLQYMLYAAQTDFREFQPPEELSGLGMFPDYHRKVHASPLPNLDASFGEASVPCQVSAWMNGVAMYVCRGQASAAAAEQWYGATIADLQQLQYLWQFKIDTRDTGHSVDAGPTGCQVAPMEGPYIADGPYLGQCPLHLESVKQPNGTVRIYLWLTSYTSPLLLAKADGPARSASQQLSASQSAPPAPAAPKLAQPAIGVSTPAAPSAPASASVQSSLPASTPATSSASTTASSSSATSSAPAAPVEASAGIPSGCGDLCRGLKKVLEERTTAFRQFRATSTSPRVSPAGSKIGSTATSRSGAAPSVATSGTQSSSLPMQLAGASICSIKALPSDGTHSASSLPLSRVNLTPTTLKRKTSAPGTQYVCYWPAESASAAETRFQDLSALLEFLIPSTWSARQETQTDELSGAKVTVWSAHDAADRPIVGLYLSGQSVGLHISSASQ